MSDNSAKPILVAGAIGTVVLLGIAWMFAASSSRQAVVNAENYAASRVAATEAAVESVEPKGAEAEVKPADAEPEVAETEAEAPAEPEVAEADTPAETEVVEAKEEEAPAEPEVVEAEAETPAETEVAEAETPAEPETAEVKEEAANAEVAEQEAETPSETVVAEAEAEKPVETAVAAAPAVVAAVSIDGDAKAGAKVFRKCKACHKIGEGAKNAVGPQLTGIVGRVQGSIEGFKYSDGFKTAMSEGKEWTPAELDAFLTKPKEYMKGTKMAFGGLRKEKDRANVIAYLAEAE